MSAYYTVAPRSYFYCILLSLSSGGSNQFQHFQETFLLQGMALQHFITYQQQQGIAEQDAVIFVT